MTPNTADSLITEASAHYNKGKFLEAAELCAQVLKFDFQNPLAHSLLGLSYLSLGRNDLASNHLSVAVQMAAPDFSMLYALGFSLEAQGRVADAQPHYEKAIQLKPDFLDAHIHLAQVYLNQKMYRETLDAYLKAVALDPKSEVALKGIRSLAIALNDFTQPGLSNVPESRKSTAKRCILINGMECTAGVFVVDELRQGLGLERRMRFTNELRDNCTVIGDRVIEMQEKGGVAHSHIDPRIENLGMLTHLGFKKFVIHMRDPRQSLISAMRWYDIAYKQAKDDNDPFRIMMNESLFPGEYFSRPEPEKIDMMIQVRFPRLIDFIDGWLKASNDPKWGFELLFTRFEDFKTDRNAFYNSIADFYKIPQSELQIPAQEPTPESYKTGNKLYFRRGSLDEWRSVVSKAQSDRMLSLMPDGLLQRFGWTP